MISLFIGKNILTLRLIKRLKNTKILNKKVILKHLKSFIEKDIVEVKVDYIDYNGNIQKGIIEVNKDILEKIKAVFDELLKIKFPIYKVDKSYQRNDEDIINDNITTGYNYRYIMGTDELSKHAKGYAIDLNPKVNPAKPSKISHVYDESIEKGKITKEVIDIFKKHGFKWGGEIFDDFWDSHHFEI